MKAQTIAVAGLDRLGASLALAFKQAFPKMTIVGHDGNNALARQAVKEKILDKAEWSLGGAAANADIIVLNVRAADLADVLERLGQRGTIQSHALVLNISPGKARGEQLAATHLSQGHYVGAAPVLAAECLVDGRQGLDAARADLFQKSIFCFMPAASAEPKAVETAVHLGRAVGAAPFFVDAAEFDQLKQGIDAVPGLLAAALFGAVTASPGWRDMLRFADAPFAHATQPLSGAADRAGDAVRDREATLRWLDAVIDELQRVREWVVEEDAPRLAALLDNLDLERDKWLFSRIENNWNEVTAPGLDEASGSMNLFGRFLSRDRDQESRD